MASYYDIFIDGVLEYSDLTEDEYFDRMEDLSEQYYLTGSPNPKIIKTKIKEN